MAPPKRGDDYYYLRPPSESLRLWAMTITGLICMVTAMSLLVLVSFNWMNIDREWEEVSTLLVVGVTFLWFGSPRSIDPGQFSVTSHATRVAKERMHDEKSD
jgi:multisubunit Na+/H+ antiporter MnhB subunit